MVDSIQIQKNDFSLPVIEVMHTDIQRITDEIREHLPLEEDLTFSLPCILKIDLSIAEPTFLARLLESFRQLKLLPIGLKTDDSELAEQAEYAGLAIFDEKMNQLGLFDRFISDEKVPASRQTHLKDLKPNRSEKTIHTHYGHIRHGEQVYAKDCDLIVLGDVEQGAEVVSDGNIYIGGCLNGKAYAGNSGFINIDEIQVRAYVFEPELVSISGFYQLKEDIPENYLGLPVKTRFVAQRFQYELD